MLIGWCAVIHHSDCPHGRDRLPVEPNVAFQGQLVQVSRTWLLERERIHCCPSALRLTPRRGRCVEDLRDARRQPREEKFGPK